MSGIRRDRFLGQGHEIHDVRGDEQPVLSSRVAELGPVIEPRVTDLMGARGVDPAASQEDSGARREILVMVRLPTSDFRAVRDGAVSAVGGPSPSYRRIKTAAAGRPVTRATTDA